MKLERILEIFKRQKILIIILLLIVVEVIWFITSKDTHAYYGNSEEIPFISGTIGKFAADPPPTGVSGTDINVIILMQDEFDSTKYNRVNYLPVLGYKYNSSKSKCLPSGVTTNSFNVTADKIDISVSEEDTAKQIVCQVYYDKTTGSDLTVYALVEDNQFGTETFENKTYRFESTIPDTTKYDYNKAVCKNAGSSSLSFDATAKTFKFTSTNPNTCYAYFVLK